MSLVRKGAVVTVEPFALEKVNLLLSTQVGQSDETSHQPKSLQFWMCL